MHDDRAAQLAYAYTYALPLWEKWSDGDPCVRRLLECTSVDPSTYDAYLQRIFHTTAMLRTRGTSPSVKAALAAASVCCNAYVGVPAARFEKVCQRAFMADKAVTLS